MSQDPLFPREGLASETMSYRRDTTYIFQSRNRLLLRRAISCFAFPAHALISSDHTPVITLTRYLPVIISYSPCAQPLELPASQASQSRHISLISVFLLSTERIDESYIKAPTATSNCRLTTSEDAWAFLGDKADMPLAYRVKVHKCAAVLWTFRTRVILQHFVTERDISVE